MGAGSSAYQGSNGRERSHQSERASLLPAADCSTNGCSKKHLLSIESLSPPGDLILEKAKEFGKEMQNLHVVTVSDSRCHTQRVFILNFYYGIERNIPVLNIPWH